MVLVATVVLDSMGAAVKQVWSSIKAAKYEIQKPSTGRATFRNRFLQPATNVFVTRQVDHAK